MQVWPMMVHASPFSRLLITVTRYYLRKKAVHNLHSSACGLRNG